MRLACGTMDKISVSSKKQTLKEIRVSPADHDLTVIIPAFNEEQRLPWTLDQLADFLNDWGIDYRVLVAKGILELLSREPRCTSNMSAFQMGAP